MLLILFDNVVLCIHTNNDTHIGDTMNSAMVRKQKRQARLDFIASAIGWSTIAALNYLLFTGVFFMINNPLSTIIN